MPLRLKAVQALLCGAARNDETVERVARLAVAGAETLDSNASKVTLMENLARRAIRGA